MIRILIAILLFLAAVALSPILIGEKGYLLMAMGNITIESTVITAIIFLVFLFIGLIITLKIFRGSVRISINTWRIFSFASQRKGQRNFNKGIAAYLLEDYEQAEQLLIKSAEPAKQEPAAYLTAAMAAQQLNKKANAAHYIQLLEHQQVTLSNVGLESVLVQLKLLITQGELNKARTLIDNYHTHIGHDHRLLSLAIELDIAEQHFSSAITFLDKAKKHKAINAQHISQWESQAYLGYFNELITNQNHDELLKYWASLSKKTTQSEAVLLAYCQILAKHHITEPLTKILLPAIKKDSSPALISALKTLPLTKVDVLMTAVQKHLLQDQHNTQWLSCLGHLAYKNNDWPMAERAFHSLQAQLNNNHQMISDVDLRIFAQTLFAQQKYQQAAELLIQYK